MTATVNLNFLQLEANQASPEVIYNDNLEVLDILINTSVISTNLTSPPSASNGDVYIPAVGSTGAWSGHDLELAYYYNGWDFIVPKPGWRIYNQSSGGLLIYDGLFWTSLILEGSFTSAAFNIKDSSDQTKEITFDLSNMSTSTSIDIVVKSNTNYVLLKQNLGSNTSPTSSDSSSNGYSIGSLWIDTTNDNIYYCVDATAGSAIWKQINNSE